MGDGEHVLHPGAAHPDAVVWQGRPGWRSLARRMFHIRGVSLYVGLVVGGTAAASAVEGDGLAQVALTAAPLFAGGALVLGFLAGLAWLVARTTTYTLTQRHLVIRFGIAIPATLAIPYAGIAHAAVAMHPDGTGDLPIQTKPGCHVALRRCWPHARPWHVMHPQPMLRSVPEAGRVAALLAQTLAQAAASLGETSLPVVVLPAADRPSSARHIAVTELTPAE